MDQGTDLDEVAGAVAVGLETEDERYLWHVLSKKWDPAFEHKLVDRILEGHAVHEVRVAALACLSEQVPERLPAICQEVGKRGHDGRLVEIALELGAMRVERSGFDGSRKSEAGKRTAAFLPPPLKELSEAAFALEAGAPPSLSDEARNLLARITPPSEEVRLFRVSLDERLSMVVPEDVRWLLANTEEASNAVKAINFAIRHGMAAEIEAGLSHRFAAVVARSLTAIATPQPPPLPEALLSLARHEGSPVRRALVELLDAKTHPQHLPTLLLLAKDRWSSRSTYYGEADDYPIAQAAIAAIAKLAAIEDRAADDLYRLAIDTRDPDVRCDIFGLLVRAAASRFQGDLFELSVSPGRRILRQAAAQALLVGYEYVVPDIVERITPHLLGTQIEVVASRLLLLLAIRGDIDQVARAAEALSAMEKRRVLLLLAIWGVRDRDATAAVRIARMMPANHSGVKWALAGAEGKIDDTALDDLGDPISVEQVLHFMRPNN